MQKICIFKSFYKHEYETYLLHNHCSGNLLPDFPVDVFKQRNNYGHKLVRCRICYTACCNIPDYPKMWWSIPDDATPKQRWGFSIGNFLLTMTVCWATLDLPRESLSDISITLYASLPVFIVIMAFIVRRLIIKKNSNDSEN